MKPFTIALVLAWQLPAMAQDFAADSTGLPGDNFSLQGALELFKRNIEMEKFEEELNTDSTHVNNLDLDGNGETDYVRVETQRDGDAVIVVMKATVNATESQDVAVIEIEKTGEGSATLQIIGDDDLYPPNTIIEPFAEEDEAMPTKGPRAPEVMGVHAVVNVWFWRPIPWCFSPRFYVYSSPWYWGHYPPWWRPWHVHPWHAWYGWGWHHHHWYRPWYTCRVAKAHAMYAPRRARSAVVHARYQDAHQRHATRRPSKETGTGPARQPTPKAVRPSRVAQPRPAHSPKGNAKPQHARPPKSGGKKR